MVERVGGKLDLDAAQKQKLDVLADKLQAQRAALCGGERPAGAVQGADRRRQVRPGAAPRLVEDKTAALRAGSPEVIAAAADFFDSLDPAQQQQGARVHGPGRRWGRHG